MHCGGYGGYPDGNIPRGGRGRPLPFPACAPDHDDRPRGDRNGSGAGRAGRRSGMAEPADHHGAAKCRRRRRCARPYHRAHLSDLLGHPVIVENVTGAGGMVGSARVATAADGYQFVLGNAAAHTDETKVYTTAACNTTTTLRALRSLPGGRTGPDCSRRSAGGRPQGLHQLCAAEPGVGCSMARAARARPCIFACALLNAAAGVEITHVPFRGNTPAMQELIAGRIDYECPTVRFGHSTDQGELR